MEEFLIDEQFLTAITAIAKEATKSIYISTFKAERTTKRKGEKLKEFFDVLTEKARTGVDVRLIINKGDNRGHIPTTNIEVIRLLKQTKIKVRHLTDGYLCHAKIFIVDKTTAVCGSHNLSVRSCHNNFEVSCQIKESIHIKHLADVYEWKWENAKDN